MSCAHRFGAGFIEHYLLPMTAAIWSTPVNEMLNFPASTLIRFMRQQLAGSVSAGV